MLPSIDALRFSAPGIEGIAPLLKALLLKVGRARCDISLSRKEDDARKGTHHGGWTKEDDLRKGTPNEYIIFLR